MRRRNRRPILLLLAAVCLCGATAAQQRPPAAQQPLDGELREAIQRYFQTRLRVELGLTDEQMAQITPRIERMERARAGARRQRTRTVFELRRGLREGADDERLQALLDQLERIEQEQRGHERAALEEIDALLTVRQRVQLRFFIERFRRELQRKVQQLRSGEAGPGFRRGR